LLQNPLAWQWVGVAHSTLCATSLAYFKKKDMKSFGPFCEIEHQGATG